MFIHICLLCAARVVGPKHALAVAFCIIAQVMVSAARIEWMLTQLRQGRQVRLRLNSHLGKLLVHAELLDHFCPNMHNQVAIDVLIALRAQLASNVVVDHGHKTSEGSSRISFSFTWAPTGVLPTGALAHASQPDNGDDGSFNRLGLP